jgi:hypothetical protein
MSWNTEFSGRFTLDRPLSAEHRAVLEEIASTRHAGGDGKPDTPYCQWVPSEDGMGLEWDDGDKFYFFEEWLEYLVLRYIKPWGYVLNGSVRWIGTTHGDYSTITVVDNEITFESGEIGSETDISFFTSF